MAPYDFDAFAVPHPVFDDILPEWAELNWPEFPVDGDPIVAWETEDDYEYWLNHPHEYESL